MIGRVIIVIGRFGLHHDRDYGVSKRTGWSAVWDGSVMVQFVSLPRALWVLARSWWES